MFILLINYMMLFIFFFFSSRRRHTRFKCDWSSDVCSSDLLEKDVPALCADQLERGVHQRHQDFIKHADSIEFAGGLQEKRQLLEVGGIGGNLNSGNLAEEFAGCVRSRMLRAENYVRDIPNPELHAVVALH